MTDRLLCEHEFKTRELVEADRKLATFNPFGQMLRSAILASWSSALPAERLIQIGAALHGHRSSLAIGELMEIDGVVFKKELARMVRAKVLRTRREVGQKLYEVNY